MKEPYIISADDDTNFASMIMCRTITKAMNSNCKCMKREFSTLLGYYFADWKAYVFNTPSNMVKCVWEVPYAERVTNRTEKCQ